MAISYFFSRTKSQIAKGFFLVESLYVSCSKNWKMDHLSKVLYNLPLCHLPPSHTFHLIWAGVLIPENTVMSALFIFISPTGTMLQKHRQAVAVSCQTDKSKLQRLLCSATKVYIDAGILNFFLLFEKNNRPKTEPQLLQVHCTCLQTVHSERHRLQVYICLWFVVSVTANLTQPTPQVSVIAQEMLSPPTLGTVRVCASTFWQSCFAF